MQNVSNYYHVLQWTHLDHR